MEPLDIPMVAATCFHLITQIALKTVDASTAVELLQYLSAVALTLTPVRPVPRIGLRPDLALDHEPDQGTPVA